MEMLPRIDVLFASDNDFDRRFMSGWLPIVGECEATIVSNAQEMLEAFSQQLERFPLVITGFMRNEEAARKIKKLAGDSVIVALYSGYIFDIPPKLFDYAVTKGREDSYKKLEEIIAAVRRKLAQ